MRQIYYIGGSPCCGKSTVAELIAKKYNFQYFKVDDLLEVYINKGAKLGKPLLSKISEMSLDKIWLREPEVQNLEEQYIYNEMFEFILEDLNKLNNDVPIITEGAAFLPNLMSKSGVGKSNYICIVPTNEFQYEKYSQRPWVMQYLEGCSNKELAFENWMKRDYLFADTVLKEALKLGYSTLVVDGKRTIDENLDIIEEVFKFK
ncbi:AAA family ATPase [Clostridium sp. BNL1100]|uniref:AAA family ATPase n=1 Tax=Clostridium sp. BNL1100 TaxID=755731 RepID=UPI00024A7EB3|nr:AAA family ATPase [Clostridium sp. BNL1100]AEY64529.1 shikimate kinase [Clostridium sp. BNL1100]